MLAASGSCRGKLRQRLTGQEAAQPHHSRAPGSPAAEMHRMRLDVQGGEKERARLGSRVQAKEREIGGLLNKVRTG